MNTLIHLWIEPLVKNHERSTEKLYFNTIIKGDYSALSKDELDELLSGEHMADIMDFADIDQNWNFKSLWAKRTSKPLSINQVDSPQQKKEKEEVKKINKEIQKIVTNKTPLGFNAKNVELQDGGKINISVPALRINDTIDFAKIWDTLEKNFIGKIKEGDQIILTDDDGNTILEMTGGSFLNVGLADLNVYDSKKLGELGKESAASMFSRAEAVKGGVFLREDGSLDIGDSERTFYLKIYTDKLLKASLKLNKSLMDITQQKLLS